MKQRFLSALLVLAMLLTLTPVTAFAEEAGGLEDDSPIIHATHPGVGSIEDILPLSNAFGIVSDRTYTGNYYNQLDDSSKIIYDAIYASNSPLRAGPSKEKIAITGATYTDESDRSAPIVAALGALLYDHPELSWLVNTRFGYSYNETTKAITSFYMHDEGYTNATTAPDGTVTAQNIPVTWKISQMRLQTRRTKSAIFQKNLNMRRLRPYMIGSATI